MPPRGVDDPELPLPRGDNLTPPQQRGYPLGFDTQDEFGEFGQTLYSHLETQGYPDTRAVFSGSSVTGHTFNDPNIPFRPDSDFDVALVSEDLMQRARDLGFPLRSGGNRTAPLTGEQLRILGLLDMQSELSSAAGRDVHFMIYDSLETLEGRGQPIIEVPRN